MIAVTLNKTLFPNSKLIGIVLQLETWLDVGIVMTLGKGLIARPRFTRWSGGVVLVYVPLFEIVAIGEVVLRPLKAELPTRPAPAQFDGIDVLGGAEDHRPTANWCKTRLNEAAERTKAAAALAIIHPGARMVFSGGSGRL